jgi:hypothetical protein
MRKGPSINDVTAWGGKGIKDFGTKDLLLESMTMGMLKIIKYCETSFIDDPKAYDFWFLLLFEGVKFLRNSEKLQNRYFGL